MTGAETLQKILASIDKLNTTVEDLKISIKLIEGNIKILNNRAAGLLRNNTEPAPAILPISQPLLQPTVNQLQAGIPTTRGRQLTSENNLQEDSVIEKQGTKTYKKVFGKLINGNNEPIENVLIKIYDKNNEVCATTETDPIGYWSSMVIPGRYSVEYTKPGFKTSNKTFEIKKNSKELEIK